jgi:hypothetical protein
LATTARDVKGHFRVTRNRESSICGFFRVGIAADNAIVSAGYIVSRTRVTPVAHGGGRLRYVAPREKRYASAMRHKAVTEKKIEANRNNSKRSTGPRTERGRRSSRFNAVTLGIFAKHVVIAGCDGDNSEKEFGSLLDDLHEEFQPVGTFEEWLVLKIAECIWRLRRGHTL